MSPLAAQSIKGFELLDLIGEGSYGAVYRAIQARIDREVAIKIIHPEYANQPLFIRRFENEAQLVAQLEHLHIVPLYDYWRDPGGAFLVMRLMKGGSLQKFLRENEGWKTEDVVRLVDQIASALDAAHLQGVVHRDIKPANILLDENGNAYLSDFGIAKEIGSATDITHTSAILGTPGYISPEQVRNQVVTPQTDIYAFGVLIFELLVGKHPFPETSTGELLAKHLSDLLPYVRDTHPELPAAVDGVIQRATAKNPHDRYPSALALAGDLRDAFQLEATFPEKAELDLINPYKGLRAFQEYDCADFFGREILIGQLLARQAAPGISGRFSAVVGPSGSGKSSVVKAGLLPALRSGALPGSDQWFIVEMTPGLQPLHELEMALLSITNNASINYAELLKKDRMGLSESVKLAVPGDGGEILLFIDQFEELFSLVADEELQNHFLESLFSAVTDPQGVLRVVITLRADFYDRPLIHLEFGRLIEEHTMVVLPLTLEEMEKAIQKPAERAGSLFEKGLVSTISADLISQPGALPLLQYALTELFEHREGRLLTHNAYRSIGGVLGALGRRAEQVFANLDNPEKNSARQLFLRLVTLGEGAEDTRRRVMRSEVTSIQPETAPGVLGAFGRARLLTFDHDPETREPTVEVAHEALLQEWRRLRSWLDNSRADIRMQRVLANAASEWESNQHNTGYLLRDTRLDQFEAWAASSNIALTELEADYLAASLVERRARQVEEDKRLAREAATERRSRNFLRGLVAVLTIATIVAVVLTIFAFNQREEARYSAATAQAEALARATQQGIAESEADLRATQQAIAEGEANARATAEAIAIEERDKVLRQASVTLAGKARELKELGDPELAVLLTMAVLEEYPYTPQAEKVLAESVVEVPTARLKPGNGNSSWLAVAWSPKENRIATAIFGEYLEPTILIHDPQTETEILEITLGVDCSTAFNIAWSPSGDRLIAIPQFCDFAPQVLDVQSGELLTTLASEPEQANFSAAWSPDGKSILTGSLDGTLRIWDAQSGNKLRDILAHDNYLTRVAWSPAGDLLATGSDDDKAKLWDSQTGELLHILSGYQGDIVGLSWSPDSEEIAVVSLDSTTMVWNAKTGESLFSLDGHDDQVRDVAWSPDAETIATDSRDGLTRFWKADTGKYLFGLQNQLEEQQVLNSIDWSPNGDQLVIMGVEYNQVWDISTKPPLLSGHTRGLNAAQWSPDGKLIATAGLDNMIGIWDAFTGEMKATLQQTGEVEDIAWSPDGSQLAASSLGGGLQVWDIDSQTYHTLPGSEGFTFDNLSWSPLGSKFVASSKKDLVSFIWDLNTGQVKRLEQENLVCYLASPSWSPKGDRFITGCEMEGKDSPARFWDAETGRELNRLESNDGSSQLVAWSPDGQWIAVGYSEMITRIYEAASLQPMGRFSRHHDRLVDLRFSPNSQRVVSIDAGRRGLVWDIHMEDEVWSFQTTRTPSSIDWSPEGDYVIAATLDPLPMFEQVWQSLETLLNYAAESVKGRELDAKQRQQFGLLQE